MINYKFNFEKRFYYNLLNDSEKEVYEFLVKCLLNNHRRFIVLKSDEIMTLAQNGHNEYNYKFVDSADDSYTVKYTPVHGEAAYLDINIVYQWTFYRNSEPVDQTTQVSQQLVEQTNGSYSYEIPFELTSKSVVGSYPSDGSFTETTAS